MPKSRPPYAAEFRRQMVELVRSGRTPEALAREFEPSAQAIRNWVAQAGRDAGERTDGLRTGEREEATSAAATRRARTMAAIPGRVARTTAAVPGRVVAANDMSEPGASMPHTIIRYRSDHGTCDQ